MSHTRNNHYVPKWYQEGFIEPGKDTLGYLDLSPASERLTDGRVITRHALFNWTPTKCFRQLDLYTTFFGASPNDEIERRLFGVIDTKGANAVRAFIGTDVHGWIEHFEAFFTYIDAQKLRTPRGLDWLKAQYPALDRNELLFEMQGIRTVHCSIWSGGVREIVSAEDSNVKFIVTDHPVTIYNYAVPPEAPVCRGAGDPHIALKASQTLFPLNRDFCLILTNLEYARDPAAPPLQKRIFPRNFNDTLVKADAMIRQRRLNEQEVARVNYVLKRRARRFVAAGKREWLYPESVVATGWSEIRETLLPPQDALWGFGGEIYVRYQNNEVRYQDEFGRAHKPWEFLTKDIDERSLRPGSLCGCGSGARYRTCCQPLPAKLRPTWTELSIRERNFFFQRAVVKELALETAADWVAVRRDLTDEKIKRLYGMFSALWPRETDLLALLPKPDGRPRAVYTGAIQPAVIPEFALGAPLYFGELLIEHPFIHAGAISKKYSPVEHPRQYRQEFLKSVVLFLHLMPLVEAGLVILVPDPGNFDPHLRHQTMDLAQRRMTGVRIDPKQDPRAFDMMREDAQRSLLSLPGDVLRNQIKRLHPDLDEEMVERVFKHMESAKLADPLAVLQDGAFEGGEDGGAMNMYKLAPNFEMTMYLAQAIGGSIVTDNRHRWDEIQRAIRWRLNRPSGILAPLAQRVAAAEFRFPNTPSTVLAVADEGACNGYSAVWRQAIRYATRVPEAGSKPNVEGSVAARFGQAHAAAQVAIAKAGGPWTRGQITASFPWGGIQDNTINRLLLMSSSEYHLPSATMAFFITSPDNPD